MAKEEKGVRHRTPGHSTKRSRSEDVAVLAKESRKKWLERLETASRNRMSLKPSIERF